MDCQEPDAYDLMAELLLAGHGDKTDVLCNWYVKYKDDGLSHQALRMILVCNGYLPNPLQPVIDRMRKK